MTNLPPVVNQNGFRYFVISTYHGIGYASAKTIGGRRHYAKDYPVTKTQMQDEFDFIEPNDSEWLRMMK